MLDNFRAECKPEDAEESAIQYLEIARGRSDVLDRVLTDWGRLPIGRYLNLLKGPPLPAPQGLEELETAVFDYAAPLLGEAVAAKAAQELSVNPVVLTANHHGVDCFAQSVQGSLLFSLFKRSACGSFSTVPVFSCGNIPLDNITYPLGMLLYPAGAGTIDSIPKKLPVFSNRYRRMMVSVSDPFDGAMVDRAMQRAGKMVQEGGLSPAVGDALLQIFMHDYRLPQVLNMASYSEQAVVLNNRIWKRLFEKSSDAPELIYLELEKIVNRLLRFDLKNPESLAWKTLFNPELRESLLFELDGTRGCWEIETLERRLRSDSSEPSEQNFSGCGTLFFWGISGGRRVPLSLSDSGGILRLCGVDDHGAEYHLPLEPDPILEALGQNRLIPSLFTCFLVLSLARGVTCAGGYYQGNYLPEMQQGLAIALRNSGLKDIAEKVSLVKTYAYLSGMQAIMLQSEGEGLIPAGPVEIIASGGLDEKDMEKILRLTVREAHIASLFETIPDIAPRETAAPDWKTRLAEELGPLLGDRVVVKAI